MDPQTIADAYAKAGIDTFEQVDYYIKIQIYQAQLRRKELEIDGLAAKRAEVLKPLDDEKIQLVNERNDLITLINDLIPPA